MKKIKFIVPFAISIFTAAAVYTYNWPLENAENTNIKSYFGQNINNSVSTSIIFKDPSDITAIGDGKLLMLISDDKDESLLFPSSLGTSVLIAHKDDLVSVYANLERDTIPAEITNGKEIATGDKIGSTGNSGFQVTRSNLEFQIFDTAKSSAINPRIFMPRYENEIPLYISDLKLVNKNGESFPLTNSTVLKSGLYKLYMRRNPIACPYKTAVSINGVEVDRISYDKIDEETNKIFLVGKKQYINTDIYPDSEYQLIGEAMLTPGRSTLGISVEDFIGNDKRINYVVEIR
ncbi:MAG: M23 family metallopeptidase [Treponema sp.]|nr:M23 family metallopeptidase [Treponema sp.]